MSVSLAVGTQWGDEGKAKAIDFLTQRHNIVVRFQGGANAGHTVNVDGDSHIFNLIPSGILNDHVTCILGGGMVIDVEVLFQEIEILQKKGIRVKDRIRLADNAHLVLPFHKLMDSKEEEDKDMLNIGTTKKGIGFCYADKVARYGVRLGHLFCDDFYSNILPSLVKRKNLHLEKIYNGKPLKLKEMTDYLKGIRSKISGFMINAPYYLNMEAESGRKILLEGAQGTMLDVDFGTYPYVTSSSPTTGGALSGSGLNFRYLKEVIGVTKAYTTRVGEGPFPSELDEKDSERLRELGNEFGSVTGRSRRCGWFDVPVIRHSAKINGLTSLFLSKLDVLDSMDTIKVGVGYELQGKRIDYFPSHSCDQIKVLYETFPGWKESTAECRKFKDIPKNARKYIHALEKFCGIPIKWISVGPGRKQTIEL